MRGIRWKRESEFMQAELHRAEESRAWEKGQALHVYSVRQQLKIAFEVRLAADFLPKAQGRLLKGIIAVLVFRWPLSTFFSLNFLLYNLKSSSLDSINPIFLSAGVRCSS